MSKQKSRMLFTSHTANFNKFNRPLMRMLRGKLEAPYSDLNIGGWTVDYACACEEPVYDADNIYKIDFARNPLRFDKHVKAYRQLKKLLTENDYRFVHTHTPVGSIVTRMATKSFRKKGLKVIYTCHGFHFYDGAPKKNWLLYYRAEKMMAKYTDLIITINQEDFQRAENDFHCPVKMIDGVGIDTTKFKQSLSAQKRKALRAKIGLENDDFAIMYVAEFIDRKNHRMLFESCAPLMQKDPKLKLVLLGEGELLGEMKELAKQLNIDRQVLFLGYLDNVHEVLQCGNLCVSTSKSEGLGLGVLEAVLCGLPILISNNRGHRDIVGKDKKYLFELGDIEGLKTKIKEACEKPDKYQFTFPERYSLRSSLSEMKEIYEEFLK